MHFVGYLYEDYHHARSLEHKVRFLSRPFGIPRTAVALFQTLL
jgi:hypothetical protein